MPQQKRKLTPDEVKIMRTLYNQGIRTREQLVEDYGVSISTICHTTAVLSSETVERYLAAGIGERSDGAIARDFGVTRQAVTAIRRAMDLDSVDDRVKERQNLLAQAKILNGAGVKKVDIVKALATSNHRLDRAFRDAGLTPINEPPAPPTKYTRERILLAIASTDTLRDAAVFLGMPHPPGLHIAISRLGIREEVDNLLIARGYTRRGNNMLYPHKRDAPKPKTAMRRTNAEVAELVRMGTMMVRTSLAEPELSGRATNAVIAEALGDAAPFERLIGDFATSDPNKARLFQSIRSSLRRTRGAKRHWAKRRANEA